MNKAVEVYNARGEHGRALVPVDRYGAEDASADTLDLRALTGALRRRQGLLIGVFLGVMFLTVLIMVILTPVYTATAEVVIDMRKVDLTPPSEQVLSSHTVDPSGVTDTEVQVIQSNEMAEAVDQAMALDTAVEFDPTLAQPGPISRLRTLLTGKKTINPRLYDKNAQHVYVINQLKRNLTVTRLGSTYTIQISFTSPDQRFSKRVADEYARQYAMQQSNQKSAATAKAAQVLRDRLDTLAKQAEADTRAVQEYRIQHNLLSANAQSLTEQEVATYDTQLANARAQAAEDQSRLATALRQQNDLTGGNVVGDATSSPVVASLRTQRAQAAASLANLQAHYGPAYPEVVKLKSQIADLDGSIRQETQSLIQELRARANVSKERLGSTLGSTAGAKGTLAGSNKAMIDFQALQLKAQASQTLYDTYLGRYKETVAQQGTETSQARVVSWSDLPNWPSTPNLIIYPLLGLLLAIGASIAAALLAELLFAGLTTGAEVEQRLGIRYLGGLPATSRWSWRGWRPRRAAPAIDRVVEEPGSAFAEAFRNLLTTVNFIAEGRKQVIMMTSALPQEGKSTAAICLARSIALRDASVLLIDCDLRRRTLNRLSSDGRRPGLVEVLRGDATLDEALVPDEASGAFLLPINARASTDGGILVGGALAELLSEARTRFDYIVIDTAPILPVTETRVIATYADAVVMLVRWRKTADHAVRAALRLLPEGRAYVAGVALSRINMRKQSRIGYGDAHAYYRLYKSYYA